MPSHGGDCGSADGLARPSLQRLGRVALVLAVALLGARGAWAQQTISCSSDDGKRHYCNAGTRTGVQMVKQRSSSPCIQIRPGGYDHRGIWVDRGCRADFLLAGNAGTGYGGGQTVTRSSNDGKRQRCPAMTNYGVQMSRQISGSPCIQGQTWGFDQSEIWVDKGCRADFTVGGNGNGHGNGNGYGNQPVSRRTIRCSSDNGKRNYCNVDTSNSRIQMAKQVSGSSCVEGTTWGFDSRGIWVDKGCRADFAVETGGGYGARYDDAAQGRTCVQAVGAQRANQLAQQCLQVSPATHPPCNARNTCKMITNEIKRSCKILGYNAPGFCDEY